MAAEVSEQYKPPASKLLRRFARDFVVRVFAFQPLTARRWLMSRFQRPLLKLLFSLNKDTITISPAGLPSHRFRMWLNWQGNLAFALGLYEPEATRSIRQMVKAGNCCLDVGANLGYYTISMAKWVGSCGLVVAFEPFPTNFETLERNVHLNGLKNVILAPTALSNRNGVLRLIYSVNDHFSATPSAKGYAVDENQDSIQVPTRRLDDYVAELGRIPTLIKIDVEGAELSVLEGAQNTLASVRPILLVEVHDWGTNEAAKVLQFLSEFQYETRTVGQKGHEKVLLCTPIERTAFS